MFPYRPVYRFICDWRFVARNPLVANVFQHLTLSRFAII